VKVAFSHDPLRFCPTFDDLFCENDPLLLEVWLKMKKEKEAKNGKLEKLQERKSESSKTAK